MSTKNDVEIIKKIILRMFKIENGCVGVNTLYFLDDELKELLRELGEK